MTTTALPRFLTEQEVATMTGISLGKLRNDRLMRRGFRYCKIGRSVRYPLSSVLAYLQDHTIDPEEDSNAD